MTQPSPPQEPWPVLSDEEWEQKVIHFLATTYSPDQKELAALAALPPEQRYIQLLLMHGYASGRTVNARTDDEPAQ